MFKLIETQLDRLQKKEPATTIVCSTFPNAQWNIRFDVQTGDVNTAADLH